MGWTVRKQLLCPACGDVLADALHRRFPAQLMLRAPAGWEIMPRRSAAVERELLAGDLPGDPDRATLQAMLLRHHADLIYTLTCPRGHVTYRAAPDLVRALRTTPGNWVTPA
ncbi:hypothetical protein ACWT_5560 [Actinoplanes sp. SE50]|uniref:hypothetical protein n=1 Tax=unclassified Actinoplanes TaxID=2626549 RepID=UPI00023ECD42|nr:MULTISPECIES: hypothetical protein [unclassified Actinoplanes]AEV86577.1 hypothetical protein ACPL_5690 [Actinoplanes sp. SE50/110]ATO84975.1 hypothetical protein ACWT_5560 [Actinoplanes sp. SE50]SLM02384.1 hypothetical protein ACSP50_5633 [Actinoplanes sp. SE50/110]